MQIDGLFHSFFSNDVNKSLSLKGYIRLYRINMSQLAPLFNNEPEAGHGLLHTHQIQGLSADRAPHTIDMG